MASAAAVAIANARAFEENESLRHRLEPERDYLREEVESSGAFGEILGRSPALQRVLRQVELVAATEANVLIMGESGTGKELIARAIHQRSTRAQKPLVKVNCGAIPRELFESEFFGHVRGSFTGAIRDRVGRFQLADGGTLFLDEVAEIPLELQSKLLRVLQEANSNGSATRSLDVSTQGSLPQRIANCATKSTKAASGSICTIVALRMDGLLPPRQHVLLSDVARGAVQADVVVVVHVSTYQTPRIIER